MKTKNSVDKTKTGEKKVEKKGFLNTLIKTVSVICYSLLVSVGTVTTAIVGNHYVLGFVLGNVVLPEAYTTADLLLLALVPTMFLMGLLFLAEVKLIGFTWKKLRAFHKTLDSK